MKSIQSIILTSALLGTAAFAPFPSSFTGSASSVCSRGELTTELSCPSSSAAFNRHRGRNLGMPPFLKKLGLKKPEKPIFGGDEESSDNTAVLVKEEEAKTVDAVTSESTSTNGSAVVEEEEEELSQTEKLLKQVRESGTAGVISYALWELAFWAISVPVCIFGYYELVGHMPDFSNAEDLSKLGGEAFAFVNFARFAVPLRIGLALSTTPWIQENIVDNFMKKEEEVN
mmetsp:Transcript_8210/g.12366  ORF Transcript_8210/g.12366 Transcript_8210/m.12366 type:complete len:229 (+) Transcript_8210:108-794(+)|eukprot:CAMPEP_0203682298 /NCGR_PEP_ID=MMETSP0090-20130426/45352_1 /ASSEMBLY_ACC=CAM_ASM_001088 /TAXON_ID=426623 /ORGANISM="Chaetoceros affinis, Strain CCMP159" /LENGTH=228 /DNA_ID=CAMNT_0050551171 /DNA_START=40 /DNA_END=726 /DNA_ORIENTATION=+